jgi:uncharacterized repeat protein (TIGR01451 family)
MRLMALIGGKLSGFSRRCLWALPALAVLAAPLRAAGPPSPAESILVIYTDADPTTYSVTLKNAFVTALSAVVPAPTITQVNVAAGQVGIYTSLVAQTGQTNLSSWCQVWDLRFRSDKNNVAYTGPNQEDVITFAGANNDTLLYTNYLNQNGHLFLQGEHHDFYIRDQNLFALINAVASTPINGAQVYAEYNSMNPGAIGGFPAVPNAFNTSWNNISAGTVNAAYPGGLALAWAGSGRPIGANFAGQSYSQPSNTAYVWLASDLSTNGRMVVNFETNAFVNVNATSTGWIQNVYQLLSGCYKYSLTKAFAPAQLCVGDPGTFTLCYNNTGSTSLTNVDLWDTLPSCLGYTGASTAPTASAGQFYRWQIPTIASGTSACITVNFTVNSYACP